MEASFDDHETLRERCVEKVRKEGQRIKKTEDQKLDMNNEAWQIKYEVTKFMHGTPGGGVIGIGIPTRGMLI